MLSDTNKSGKLKEWCNYDKTAAFGRSRVAPENMGKSWAPGGRGGRTAKKAMKGKKGQRVSSRQ